MSNPIDVSKQDEPIQATSIHDPPTVTQNIPPPPPPPQQAEEPQQQQQAAVDIDGTMRGLMLQMQVLMHNKIQTQELEIQQLKNMLKLKA